MAILFKAEETHTIGIAFVIIHLPGEDKRSVLKGDILSPFILMCIKKSELQSWSPFQHLRACVLISLHLSTPPSKYRKTWGLQSIHRERERVFFHPSKLHVLYFNLKLCSLINTFVWKCSIESEWDVIILRGSRYQWSAASSRETKCGGWAWKPRRNYTVSASI